MNQLFLFIPIVIQMLLYGMSNFNEEIALFFSF